MDQFHPSTSYWWIQSSNLIFRLATNSFKWRKMRTSWFKAFLWCNSGRVLTAWPRKWGSIVRSNRSLKSKWIFQPGRPWLNILRTSESIIRLNSAKTSCKQASVNSTTTVLTLMAWTRWITVKNLTKITRLKCANNGTSKPQANVLTKTNANLYTMMTNHYRARAFHLAKTLASNIHWTPNSFRTRLLKSLKYPMSNQILKRKFLSLKLIKNKKTRK